MCILLLHVMEGVWNAQQHSTSLQLQSIKRKFSVGTHVNALTYACLVSYLFLFVFLWYNSQVLLIIKAS